MAGVIVVEVILAALVVVVVWAMCWLTYWDIRETCAEQAEQESEIAPVAQNRRAPVLTGVEAEVASVPALTPYDWERETA